MPYRIRSRPLHPSQAKVYSESGRALSKRWLSQATAERQRIAATIASKQEKNKK